jgi:hypothetical protein
MGALFTPIHISHPAAYSVVLIILASGCMSLQVGGNISYLRFMEIGKIPVIEGTINGKKAMFIVDTGASCSVLNESVSYDFDFDLKPGVNDFVFGLTGESKLRQAMNCEVQLGPLQIRNHIFKTKDMVAIVSAIQLNEHITVDGIIGADILDKYSITIDFANNILAFPTLQTKTQSMYASQNVFRQRIQTTD